MGMTKVEVIVKKSHEAKAEGTVTFLVDSGAVYSVVQGSVLRRLGIRPHRTRRFHLADGQEIERKIGDAYFEYKGIGGAAPVIFGEPGDANLLGATTLEALELVLDPFKRELRPMTLSLMGLPFGCR
jgi:clan AA aspartic protease